jgi:hypothetical protein
MISHTTPPPPPHSPQIPVLCVCGLVLPSPPPPAIANAFDLIVTLLGEGVLTCDV